MLARRAYVSVIPINKGKPHVSLNNFACEYGTFVIFLHKHNNRFIVLHKKIQPHISYIAVDTLDFVKIKNGLNDKNYINVEHFYDFTWFRGQMKFFRISDPENINQ